MKIGESLKELYDIWKTGYKTNFSKLFRGIVYGSLITKGAIDALYNPNQIVNDVLNTVLLFGLLELSITLGGYELKIRSLEF